MVFWKGIAMLNRCVGVGFIAFLALFGGCGGSEAKEDDAGEDRVAITAENVEKIIGMQWVLSQMRIDGADYGVSGEMPFIKFDAEGGISGFGSVNKYFGALEIDGDGKVLWVKGLGSTRMAGAPEAMEQETAYFGGLLRIERFSVEGIHLYGDSADGKTQLVFYVPVE